MSGFEFKKSTSGGDYTGRVSTYEIASTAQAMAIGDVVVLTGTASAEGVADVDPITGTYSAGVTGVVVGFEPNYANEGFVSTGVANATAATVHVIDDPNALFEVESATTLAVTDVGLNCKVVATAATTAGNLYISQMKITGTAAAATSTFPFQIVALRKGATTGTLGDRALVRINNSTVRAGGTGI